MPPAAVIGGAALVGGIAGAMGNHSEQTQTSGVNLNAASGLQGAAQGATQQGLSDFGNMVGAGPGSSDVSAYTDNSHSLASMLQSYSQNGGMPDQNDISNSNNIASNLFASQRTQLAQNFQDQGYQANQQAALMGRSADDPVLRAKLAQDQTRQQALLQGQQGGLAQQLALQMPMQRLGFAQQQNQVLGGLASQALANRQTLASMGSGILGQQQAYQLATSQHYGTQSQSSGGGVGGALTGALGGLGAGMGAAAGMGSMMGGGGGFGGSGFSMGGSNMGSYFGGSNPFSGGLSMPSSSPGFGGFGGSPSGPSLMGGGSYVPLSNSFMGIK